MANGNRSAVWRPITNHSSDSFNPYVSIFDQNNLFLDSERKELINSLNLQLDRKVLARVVSPPQRFKLLADPFHSCLVMLGSIVKAVM